MNYRGTVIAESLANTLVLKMVLVRQTRVEAVIERHRTPWLKQWTLHTIEIPEAQAALAAASFQRALDANQPGSWYVDFKNEIDHYIVYKDQIFRVRRNDVIGYAAAKAHGIALGIPDYQVDFSPDIP